MAKTSVSGRSSAGTSKTTKTGGTTPRRKGPSSTQVSAGGGLLLGYARVSTADQNLERQRDALTTAGCTRIFEDAGISGTVASRPALDELLAHVRPGDSVVVQSLDRLGRNTSQLLMLVEDLRQREISLRILNLGIDTGTPAGVLVYTIMAALATMERDILAERVRDGLEAARRRGRVGGRPQALSPAQKTEVRRLIHEGRSVKEVAALFTTSERTIRRTVNGS